MVANIPQLEVILMKNKKMNNCFGFTMVEVLIVILILGITSAIGVLNITGMTANYIEDTAREKLVQQLRYAKTEAIARNTTIRLVRFDGAVNAYRIVDESGAELDDTTSRPFKLDDRQEVTVRFDGLNNNEVVFDSRGMITNITNGTTANIIISRNGGRTRTIRLYATGFIEEL